MKISWLFYRKHRRDINIKAFLILLFLVTSSSASTIKLPPAESNEYSAIFDRTKILADLKVFSSDEFYGRKTNSDAIFLARNFIVDKLTKGKVNPFNLSYLQPFTYPLTFDSAGVNVVASVLGTKYPNEFIVLSAHYDHLGTIGEQIYNGADDNASGVIALLHIAEKIKQKPLQHSVIFVFIDAEEVGLEGSKAFISHNAVLIPHFKVNINLDMIAGDLKTKSLRYITHGFKTLLSPQAYNEWLFLPNKLSINLIKGFTLKSKYLSSSKSYWLYKSDHGAFYQAGIPFIYFGVNPHANYHTFDDDFKHVNKTFYVEAVTNIYTYIRSLDSIMKQ